MWDVRLRRDARPRVWTGGVRELRDRPVLAAAATAATVAGLVALLRRGQLRWGATTDEARSVLPGDDLVAPADLVATRAIDVAAAPADIMPWLRQLGQGRGGFYTYDHLENLLGLNIHSADRIRAAWQEVAVGDQVNLAEGLALDVAVLTDRALVLHGVEEPATGPMPFDFTWAFVVTPAERGSRLLIRERYAYRIGWAPLMVEPTSWVAWFMTQRMLRGIRDRAEALAADRG